ncbi:uncharacterized protein [Amphiura filiformis]|uniref:uncharacterized protein n=1 Tax=Amphiura filiformis TaxID=82378 RepID=UPI003B225392
MFPRRSSAPNIFKDDAAMESIKWTGVHDLASITKSYALPILARALASHYGNSDLSALSRLDMLKIHKAVIVDLVLARFERSGKPSKTREHSSDLTVDMVDESSVQICFPKDFCGLFQLAQPGEKMKKKFKNAKELAQYLPRIVKVVKCGHEFPDDVSEGDIIQIIGEVNEDGVTYIRIKRNKIGAEPIKMGMRCKGKFETFVDPKHYSLSEILELFSLPVMVNLPKKSKQALNVKSEVLSLLNHVGGTLTLQREVASEFFVASTTVHKTSDQTTVLVLSKNANVQFEVAEDMACEKYQRVLESFGSVALKGIPQELFISEHGMPFVACLNYRKHTKSITCPSRLQGPVDKPPTPPPRPVDTIPERLRSQHGRESGSLPNYGKIKSHKNVRFQDRLKGKEDISEQSVSSDDSPLYERIKYKGPALPLRRSTKLEKARNITEQYSAADNDYNAEIEQRTMTMQGKSIASLSRSLAQEDQQQKSTPHYPNPGEGQFYTIPASRRNRSKPPRPPNERRDQLQPGANVKQTHLFRSSSHVQSHLHRTLPLIKPIPRRQSSVPGEKHNDVQITLHQTDEPRFTSANMTSVPCGEHTPSTCNSRVTAAVPSIAVNKCQEEPSYMYMNSGIRTFNKNFLHPQDSRQDSFPYIANKSSSPPPGSYGRTTVHQSSLHHDQHQYRCQTTPANLMTRHQFHRSESPLGDGYIKMDHGGNMLCEELPPYPSTIHRFRFQGSGYINEPRMPVVPDSSEVAQRRMKSQSLENLLCPSPSNPLVCRISPDLIPPRLPPRPPPRTGFSSTTHSTLSLQEPQHFDNSHKITTARNTSIKYFYPRPSSTSHTDQGSVHGYVMPRRSSQCEDNSTNFIPISSSKKTPPPVPFRSDVHHNTDFLKESYNYYDDQCKSTGGVRENPLSRSDPVSITNVQSHALQSNRLGASPGYSQMGEDDEEYDILQKMEVVESTADLFPPPPSPEYLQEIQRMSAMTIAATNINPVIRRKRQIPHNIGQLSVSELSQCLRLLK